MHDNSFCCDIFRLSGMRILELVVAMATIVASFVISVTITAGISRTCGALHRGNSK